MVMVEGKIKPPLTRDEAREVLKKVAQAFVDTVRDHHPDPIPSGPMYAAFMQAGGSIQLFQDILDGLVRAERLRYVGNYCYTLGPKETPES